MNDIKRQLKEVRNPNFQPDFMDGSISTWLSELAENALNRIEELEKNINRKNKNIEQSVNVIEKAINWAETAEFCLEKVETHNAGLRLALQGVIDQEPGSIAIASLLLEGLDRIDIERNERH